MNIDPLHQKRNQDIIDWLRYNKNSGYILLTLGLIDQYEYLREYVNKE